MQKTEINTPAAPAAIGPYSQAVVWGDFIFTSGQIPVDPATGNVAAGGIEAQTRQVFKNLQAVLAVADSSLSQAVKVTVFLKDMQDFTAVNAIYGEYFSRPYPARACVEVARLPKDVLIEMEVLAVRENV